MFGREEQSGHGEGTLPDVWKERFLAFRKEDTPCPTYLESAGIQSRAKYPGLSRGASHLRTQSNAKHRRNILLDGFRSVDPIRWISALIPATERGLFSFPGDSGIPRLSRQRRNEIYLFGDGILAKETSDPGFREGK